MTDQSSETFPFAAVIFDMDGVLVDTEFYYAQMLVDYAAEHGMPVPLEEIHGMVGASHQVFRASMRDWWRRVGVDLSEDEALARERAWEDKRSIDYAALMNPGVPETLDVLAARGVRLAVASSSQLKNIHAVLAACGILDRFEVVTSGEQFRESKPDPEIYLHTLEVLGLPASVCCCVEDSVPGITAGKRAGLTVIAKREERFGFSQAGADSIIDQIPDLLMVRGEGSRAPRVRG